MVKYESAYVCTHMHAREHVCTHALSTRRKMLGAIRISAQEQNFGSNAVSLLQLGDAISLLQFYNAVSAMQFHFCRRQCNSCIPALARPREILGAIQQKSFDEDDAISQFQEAIAVSTFRKCNAIFNHMESSWEAEARNAFRGLLLTERRQVMLPSCIFLQVLRDLEDVDHAQAQDQQQCHQYVVGHSQKLLQLPLQRLLD